MFYNSEYLKLKFLVCFTFQQINDLETNLNLHYYSVTSDLYQIPGKDNQWDPVVEKGTGIWFIEYIMCVMGNEGIYKTIRFAHKA